MNHSAQPHQAAASTYIIGFVASLALTILAFFLVDRQTLTGQILIGTILLLAFIQATVQLVCFMHLGREDKPRWNAIFLFNTLSIILIVVVGSIIIMHNLNSRMMSPEEMEKYSIEQSSKGY